ncbi:cytochrome c biogenesis protein ResB [Ferviditalea candida]|uniref:Cytochrome c biogenesis protein ResB n=1 Tax=Ferviditalea candida TaxID=3108399 RepID=A0ABU5ZJU3_9BACL|nr:cytochrome c biogenesis protein ResB [Paenibacillaceae bacterium T2]
MLLGNTKCECGHQNHVGTVLCEACGKPVEDDGGTAPLEMRYDGVARRSQRKNPSWLDQIWNFFSSVRNAVILIVITLLGAVLGTIYPQENTFMNVDPAQYYADNYGTLGTIYYRLGLSHTYSSWWFELLLVMIGASLVICSLDRVLPLYRALSKQKIRKHPDFIGRQRVVYSGSIDIPDAQATRDPKEWIGELQAQLRKKGYRVQAEDNALLAEKNRFSRWGPYINHIGLIIFLLAVLLRGIPGWYMDQYIGFLEGEVTRIPDTPYFLENQKFTVDFYSDEEMPQKLRGQGRLVPKMFKTKAVLYKCTADCDETGKAPVLQEVARHDIIVNDPLDYKGLLAYQFDYRETPQIMAVTVSLKNKQTGERFGSFKLKTHNPDSSYTSGPYKLELKDYFPDFGLNEKGIPFTKSNTPNAPAYIFLIKGPGLPDNGEIYVYFAKQIDKVNFSQDKLNGQFGQEYEISASSMKDVELANYTSYLNIRVDRAMPYIYSGAIIFMIGVVMGLYWQHRRIWLRIDEGNRLLLGAHTNKNWYGLKKDVSWALSQMGIAVEPKMLENGVKN